MFAFGPVPSRRLGMSLGVNNIPPKICTYSCVYCQLGRTIRLSIERRAFYNVDAVVNDVARRVREVKGSGGMINYITIVPDGEPTLDANLGKLISGIKNLNIPVAVITNASLMWRDDVRSDLMSADLVSVKIDAVSELIWRKVNRPYKSLNLDLILEGIRVFSREFKGKLISETMLIDHIDYNEELNKIAKYLSSLSNLSKAYIAVPTRPPAEAWVKPATEDTLVKAYRAFSSILGREKVEYLISFEGTNFTFIKGDAEELLRIASVHPLREDVIERFLRKWGKDWDFIYDLVEKGLLKEVIYDGKRYFIRRIR